MMVTAGAAANVQTTSFMSNSVVNYGDFGGAIFHDYVRHSQNPMCCLQTPTCQGAVQHVNCDALCCKLAAKRYCI